jgi:hypothetical protein
MTLFLDQERAYHGTLLRFGRSHQCNHSNRLSRQVWQSHPPDHRVLGADHSKQHRSRGRLRHTHRRSCARASARPRRQPCAGRHICQRECRGRRYQRSRRRHRSHFQFRRQLPTCRKLYARSEPPEPISGAVAACRRGKRSRAGREKRSGAPSKSSLNAKGKSSSIRPSSESASALNPMMQPIPRCWYSSSVDANLLLCPHSSAD